MQKIIKKINKNDSGRGKKGRGISARCHFTNEPLDSAMVMSLNIIYMGESTVTSPISVRPSKVASYAHQDAPH